MLNSQQGTETRFASQTLSLSLHPEGNGASAAPGGCKGGGEFMVGDRGGAAGVWIVRIALENPG